MCRLLLVDDLRQKVGCIVAKTEVVREMPLKGLEIWACEWEDAHWDSAEMDKGDIPHRPCNYVSVGILLRDDDQGFTVATDISESGSFRGFNYIPAKMITKKWKVGKVSPKNVRAATHQVLQTPTNADKLPVGQE